MSVLCFERAFGRRSGEGKQNSTDIVIVWVVCAIQTTRTTRLSTSVNLITYVPNGSFKRITKFVFVL